MRARARSIGAIACGLLAVAGCRTQKTIAGIVTDYDTRQPIAGATITIGQSGWGWSSGGVVWDKTYETTATSDPAGGFDATYTVGSSAHVNVTADGYNVFERWYDPSGRAVVRLKRLAPRALPLRLAHVGVAEDGSPLGWSFSEAQTQPTAALADVIPTGSLTDVTKALTLSASGAGGLRFVSSRDLGVEDDPMIYTDVAPAGGYTSTLTLDFSGPSGVIFVRTRDGAHYAKMRFTPNGLGSESGRGAARALLLSYVYNAAGDPALPFNHRH